MSLLQVNEIQNYDGSSVTIDTALLDVNADADISGSLTIGTNLTLSGNITGNLVVQGNLQVGGTTTTVESVTLTVEDPVITLGGDTPPTSDDSKDRGVEFNWHNGTAAKVGFLGMRRSDTRLVFIPDATNTSEDFTGTLGDIDASSYYVSGQSVLNSTTLGSGVISSSLTSVGTITAGTWNATTIDPAYGGTGQTALNNVDAASLGSNNGSTNATQGFVLMADGSGGSSWSSGVTEATVISYAIALG